jgi:hypothetical protein
MLTFLALYRGDSVNDARMVAVCSDRAVVADFARRVLGDARQPDDPVLMEVERGRRRALRLIACDGQEDADE